mmetsp:Transcript_42346/g.137796  ORF Transcript_42346/g.137796 Transcript_42346/m.137796 type:complete len:229 (+) Transcript_42346:165-851(+)
MGRETAPFRQTRTRPRTCRGYGCSVGCLRGAAGALRSVGTRCSTRCGGRIWSTTPRRPGCSLRSCRAPSTRRRPLRSAPPPGRGKSGRRCRVVCRPCRAPRLRPTARHCRCFSRRRSGLSSARSVRSSRAAPSSRSRRSAASRWRVRPTSRWQLSGRCSAPRTSPTWRSPSEPSPLSCPRSRQPPMRLPPARPASLALAARCRPASARSGCSTGCARRSSSCARPSSP